MRDARARALAFLKPANAGISGRMSMYHEAIEKVSKQVLIRDRYDNFIGGKWVAPVEGRYFDNPSRSRARSFAQVPRSSAADIELALDAAHKAKDAWGKTSVAGTLAHPQQDRRQARSQSGPAGAGRNARQRQADPRDDLCRHAAGRRSLALFRQRGARPGRRHLRDRSRHRRLSLSTSRSAWSARSSPGTSRS